MYLTNMEHLFDKLDISVKKTGAVKSSPRGWHHGEYEGKNRYLSVRSTKNGRAYYVHRLVGHAFITNPSEGQFPDIDHINGIKSDNTVENLRWISKHLNGLNKATRNISYRARWQKWLGKVTFKHVHYCLGLWENEEEALEVARDFKQLIFHLGYLEHIVNDQSGWQTSPRAYLHGDQLEFTVALNRLNLRARRNSRLRQTLHVLHDTFREGARVLPEFSHP